MTDSQFDQSAPRDVEGDKEPAPELTEEDIFKQVTNQILVALKECKAICNSSGQIKTSKLKEFLDYCAFKMEDQAVYQLQSDLDPTNSGWLDGVALKNLLIEQEISKLQRQDEKEVLDAYVAMGGESDGGGCVDAEKLIKTIKEDFEMTIDIVKLIHEIDTDGSGEIEFDEFKALLNAEADLADAPA